MTDLELFDAVVADLGFRRGVELAKALGTTKQSATNWRHRGFSKGRIAELVMLSTRRERPFRPAVYEQLMVRIERALAAQSMGVWGPSACKGERAPVIRISVPGAPVGKGRPRFVRVTGRTYTPAKTANYEAILAAAGGMVRMAIGEPPYDGPLQVRITAFMPVPASWSRKKQAAALEGAIRPGKPDLDNIMKMMDALNGIVWRDDAQIAEARLSKLYASEPRLEIEVEAL